jgi:hypothetical protein
MKEIDWEDVSVSVCGRTIEGVKSTTVKEVTHKQHQKYFNNLIFRTMKIQQKQSDPVWMDESGTEIPTNRLTKAEKIMEKNSYKLLNVAKKINGELVSFKELISELSNEAFEAFMAEKNAKPTKGNFTWYNFNRTIKIEVSISEPIVFDDLTLKAAKDKFDEFLTQNLDSKNDFVKPMIIESFQATRGKIDVKQVMKLVRWADRIADPLFKEGAALVNQAIRRPSSRTYFRVWCKDASGQYQNVDLNLSSI